MSALASPASSEIKAFLFGVMRLEQNGKELFLPPSATARSLLACLFHRSHPQTRSALTGIFWPEMSEERARRALSQALWNIRHSLPNLLDANSEAVSISSQVALWVDVGAFEQLEKSAPGSTPIDQTSPRDLEQALKLYRGDFLEGHYHEWVLAERERLRELSLQVMERLGQLEKAAGRYAKALELALRLSRADPLNEAAHREVMRIHSILGQPDAALRQFEVCRQTMRQEMDLAPEPETLALAEEIGQRTGKKPAAVTSTKEKDGLIPAPLIGRETDRAALLHFVDGIFNKLGGLILLEGEAGVGKTRLLQEIARDAEWRGAQVLWGQARETQSLQPYAPLVEALQAGLSPLRVTQIRQIVERLWLQTIHPLLSIHAAGLPDLEPAPRLDPAQEQTRLIEALAQILNGWAGIVPLIIILEDLHWADQETLNVLPILARRLGHCGILIVCSYRGEEARTNPQIWESLQALDRGSLLERRVLSRLGEPATGELIRRSLGLAGPAPLFEERLFHETDGNPLFVLETLRALLDESLLTRDAEGRWSTPWDETTANYTELPLPRLVEKVITNRLKRLHEPLRRMLEIISILGDQFDFATLSAVSKLDIPSVLDSARELIRRSFLEETNFGYRFGHDKIRQVVYQSLDESERRRLHRQAGEAIEQGAPGQAETLAYHFEKGESWEKAIAFHLSAGDRAQSLHAYQNAAAHFGRVLSILETHACLPEKQALDIRFDALSKRQRLFWISGQTENERADLEALTLLADHLANPLRQIFALNRKALFLTETLDDYAGGRAATEFALRLSRANADRRGEATALDILGRVHYATDEYVQAVERFEQSLFIWEELGEKTELAQARIRLGRAFKMMGRLDQTRIQYEAALRSARETNSLVDEMYAYTNLAVLSRVQGDYRAAIEFNRQALRIARTIGHRPIQATTLDNLGVAFWSLRDYGHAVESMRASLKLVREMNDRRGLVFCLNNLGDVYREIGEYELASEHLNEGLTLAREINFPYGEGAFLQGLGRLLIEQGRLKEARSCFKQAIKIGQEKDNPALTGNSLCGLGLSHLQEGKTFRASEYFEQALKAHTEAGEADYAAFDRSWLAISSMESGKKKESAALSTQAVTELEAHEGGEEVHQIYFNHWKVMRAAGEMQEAQRALCKAREKIMAQADSLTDAAQRENYLSNVAINRDILSVSEETLFRRVAVRLPHLDHHAEMVSVTWTLTAPGDEEITDKVCQRRHRLQRLLQETKEQGAEPGYKHLAKALNVGVRTIERDMASLEDH